MSLLDQLPGPFNEEKLLEKEQEWVYKLGTYTRMSCNSRLELTTRQRRNWGNV